MSRFLIVTWDGAGNLVSTLGIARRLVESGHEVRLLGHRSIDERCGRAGWEFRPLTSAQDYDAVHPGNLAEEMGFLVQNVWFSGDVARDTAAELDREATDAVLVDALMPSALCAAEASPVPTAALFHTAYCLFRGGPLLEMVSAAMPLIDGIRGDLGLDPVQGIPQLHDRCDLGLVASPREFEAPGPVPPNVHFVGPILDAPPIARYGPPAAMDVGPDPLVLVSFSTSQMGQTASLQAILDGLAQLPARVLVTTGPSIDPSSLHAPDNAQVVGYVPHRELLARASVVVTHAGLGTVMAALAHGVPLVCMPMGRDQFFNAQRVTELGAGRMIAVDADANAIAQAVNAVLVDPAVRIAAKQMATVLAGYSGSAGAVAELVRLASP